MSEEKSNRQKQMGSQGYINKNCWLVKSLNYFPGKRCFFCELSFLRCPFTQYVIISLGLITFAIIFSYFTEGKISNSSIIPIFIAVIVFSYFSGKSTENLIEMNFSLKKAKEEAEKVKDSLEVRIADRTKELEKLAMTLEAQVKDRTKDLEEGNRLRQEELIKLDETAKLLVKRDLELTGINVKLDEKVKKLEESEKLLAKAFNDLKRADKKSEGSRKALLNILEDVREEKDKTLAIISNIYSPIIVVDKDNKITLFNSAAQKFLGIKLSDLGKEISNKDNFNLNNFKPVIRNKFILYKLKDNGSSSPKTEELRINYDGEELVYKVITSKVIGGNNEYLGVMKIFLDLTRETAIDKLKSEFVSIAAHQLRTPLSAIKWVVKMVLEGDAGELNNEQTELLSKGYKSNERIIRLVDDLLDISRIEEGRFGFNFRFSNFQEVLANVVENLASPITKGHLKLIVDKPKKLPKIFMDPERINLALQNLLDNAVKYTPEFGQIKIEVRVSDKDKALEVSIKDQGVGIPKADQPKLFSKFFRAANAMRVETEGTGLGLFIAKNIIEKHKGQIGIKSEEGKGTEVYFSLPISDITKNL
ncbi:MAG: ATP-binding protein [Patescibacteria group bacterium]|nr:ATP-binding protein [Patescibacteria group bacterium]